MQINSNEITKTYNTEDILSLVDRDMTNIGNIKLLTHYEFNNDNDLRFHNVTNRGNEFLKNIAEQDYNIFDALISENGEIANFKYRLKDKMQILNEVNILSYVNAELPKELKNKYKINEDYIYLIRYFNFEKREVLEEEVEPLIDDGGLVIEEKGKFIFLEKNYKNSIEKYWTENPFKAIFKLKKDGFYLGANSSDNEENISIIEEYISDDEIIMFTNFNPTISKLQANVAEIKRIKIPFKLSEVIKKRFKKREKYIPRQKSVAQLYKTNEPQDFVLDEIDPSMDKIKLPRRHR